MKDDLGDRMKTQYENRTRCYLPRRTYTIVRVDGRAFHQYTRGLKRPYDFALMADMDTTAAALCAEVAGCAFAFVQSDEISLLLTDFAAPSTQAWFEGNLQKIVSLTASIATCAFNQARLKRTLAACRSERETFVDESELYGERLLAERQACFDSRAFTIADPTEVENYFIWRQTDATRNSISMAAQSMYSHRELQGKSTDAMQEMLWQKGINWNDYPDGCKRGRCVVRASRNETITYTHKRTGETETAAVERHFWQAEAPPVFTRDRAYLAALVPRYT